MQPKIAIIIPAYNEEKTIGAVLKELMAYSTVIVVDDGSHDHTGEIAQTFGAIVVTHDPNQGYDEALRSGFLKAIEMDMDIAVSIDADGQHDPANIQTVIDKMLETNADCIIGMRPYSARISEKIFSLYTRWRFGISDILCGLKAYKIEAIKTHTHALSLNSAGTALALSLAKSGKKINQTPIHLYKRADEARIGGALKANLFIFNAMIKAMKL